MDPRPLKLCVITAEYAPLAKAGGLADVAGALSRYCARSGHDVRTFMPAYAGVPGQALHRHAVDSLSSLVLELGPHRYVYSVSTVKDPGTDLDIYLVECPALFDRPELYGSGADEHLRFILLTRAALESCQRLGFAPDIVHCHDWHAALAPLFLRTIYAWDRLFASTRTIMTIHNLAYQGIFPAANVADLSLGAETHRLHQEDLGEGRINALKLGILYADLVTTVSPTYAAEICTPEQGMALDGALRSRREHLLGILNGVDYEHWDPSADAYIGHRFSATDLAGKRAAKHDLVTRFGLHAQARTPLLGLISRLVWQKGIDLLVDALPEILRARDACLIALGSGEPHLEASLHELAREFPGRVHFHAGYSEELAHRIEAASDMFLMPSRYEPCGLNQMYSLRYGTVPIVHRTGGLADSVSQFDAGTGSGTGIVFDHADVPGVQWAINHALNLYQNEELWTRLQQNGMRADFSSDTQGAAYVAMYRQLSGLA